MVTKHPDYGTLASRIAISNHEKNLRNYSFMGVVEKLYRNRDRRGESYPLVSKDLYKFVGKNKAWLESAIDYSRDFNFDFFGFKTLERSYLLKIQRTTWERPQDMAMRVAIGIWIDSGNVNEINPSSKQAICILNTYNGMSQGYFTHASPTLFNAGTMHNQFLSCFLFEVNDSLEGIMNPQTDAAQISKYSGGNGCHFHTVRCRGADIKGTNGESGGPIPFILNYDSTMRAWDQGGRRKGALAAYMSPEHPQFKEFVELRTTTGDIANKSRSIFLGTWIPDLFWYRWLSNEEWSCFDPNETMTNSDDKKYGPGRYLARMYGAEYEARYRELELAGKAKSKYSVHKMLVHIAAAQLGSGMPYMCYKDEVNRCSNQKNVGVVHSSNLCSEIVEPSDEDEYACCTLASICLPRYVVDTYDEDELKAFDAGDPVRVLDHKHPKNPKFDFMELAKYVRVATRNLDRIIDINKYPVYQTKLSNMRHRPLGIGAQGLADVFHKMKIAWGSEESREINLMIFETIYYAALTESCEIAYDLYKSYVAIARKEGKVRIVVDYQSRPIVHKEFVTKYDGCLIPVVASAPTQTAHNRPYQRPRFKTEWIVEPIHAEFVLADMPNPENLPILPSTAGAYTTFIGSPASEGKFQFDLRNDEVDMINARNETFISNLTTDQIANITKTFSATELARILKREKTPLSKLWEWESLREKVKKFGIRNAQLIALMPTSTTSQIMGNNECIEPYTENMYKRTTLAGEFIVVNPHLIKELCDLGLWNKSVENNIKVNNGSVQYLDEDAFNPPFEKVSTLIGHESLGHFGEEAIYEEKLIPSNKPPLSPEMHEKINDIKYRYRTAFEMSQSTLIDLAADRQAFVCQSQSLNLHMRKNMDLQSIIGMHFYAWAKGLKTGMYYLRSHPAMKAQRFTISVDDEKRASTILSSNNAAQLSRAELIAKNRKAAQLALDAPSEVCLSCSS
jgi:ribonucleoside-diphosphate reductase alpha subunit